MKKKSISFGTLAIFSLISLVVIYAAFPFYWAIISSLKPMTDLFSVDLWPKQATLVNYGDLLTQSSFSQSILNSIYVSTITVILALTLSLTTSYALGRFKFKGRRLLLLAILSVSMFPQVAVLSGLFELMRYCGLYNNLTGLCLSYMIFTLPFTIWVMTSFMREIPKDLEEAAIMDGAGPLKILWRVFIPILAPSMVTTGLLAFIAAWNEFLFALTFTLTNDQRTVPVAIALLNGGSQYELPWGRIMAACVFVTLPLVFLVFVFQRRIISGLTAGAVKG